MIEYSSDLNQSLRIIKLLTDISYIGIDHQNQFYYVSFDCALISFFPEVYAFTNIFLFLSLQKNCFFYAVKTIKELNGPHVTYRGSQLLFIFNDEKSLCKVTTWRWLFETWKESHYPLFETVFVASNYFWFIASAFFSHIRWTTVLSRDDPSLILGKNWAKSMRVQSK
jgi:hypothetical protein